MIVLLALAYVVAELFTIVKVAEAVGPLNAVALLIVASMLGAALAKRQGIHVLRRLQTTVADGRVPSAEIVASDPEQAGELFEPAESKIYRHPTFYDIPDEVKHI